VVVVSKVNSAIETPTGAAIVCYCPQQTIANAARTIAFGTIETDASNEMGAYRMLAQRYLKGSLIIEALYHLLYDAVSQGEAERDGTGGAQRPRALQGQARRGDDQRRHVEGW